MLRCLVIALVFFCWVHGYLLKLEKTKLMKQQRELQAANYAEWDGI